jgi:hypothetical protein
MTEPQKNKFILYISIFVGVITYTFWNLINEIGITIFYKGNALFIFLLALYIRQISKPSFITFFLFCLALNNLLDELLFDPQKIGWNEYIASAIIIIVYFLKDKPIE